MSVHKLLQTAVSASHQLVALDSHSHSAASHQFTSPTAAEIAQLQSSHPQIELTGGATHHAPVALVHS